MTERDPEHGGVIADDLTWREQEVLGLLGDRLTNREIAEQLHLAESTVKDYVSSILSKLYVKNRRQAVEKAKKINLLGQERVTPTDRKSNLPTERTPFIGRDDEILEIRRELDQTRLLSLIGPGGIGKTRLALKVAETYINDFSGGVFFVRLAPIRSTKDICQTIAESLKFPIATKEDPQIQLIRFLRKKEFLLVMDNFEHLIDGAEILNEILQAAPNLKVLATSRERLNLQAESIHQVGGLTFPSQVDPLESQGYDAITMFVQRAGKVRPGFEPSADELAKITKICQIVGGMPLAIELAAAWLHLLNVNDIVSELEKDLGILAAEVRDAPARHRSIRTVFDSSWGMLDSSEQELFMRLSVFRGGFAREAAQLVAGASLIQLAGLADKSFLNLDPDSGRLEVHELLRQYAQEKLEEVPKAELAIKIAHASYYAEFMQQAWEDMKSERQYQALVEIDADIENIRAAWRYYLDQKAASQIWKFIFGLWHLCWIRWWNQPGAELFAEAVSALEGEDDDESVAVRHLAMACQAYFSAWLGLEEHGYEIAKESVLVLEQFDYPKALVMAYDSLAVNAFFLNLYAEEIEAMDKMVEIASQIGDNWLLGLGLFGRGLAYIIQEEYEMAADMAMTQMKGYQEDGDVIDTAMPLIVLGHAAFGLGELEKARRYYLRCLNIAQEVNFYYAIQTAAKYLTKVALAMGKLEEANENLSRSMMISRDIGFMRDIVNLVFEYARLKAGQGDLEQAVELLALVIGLPISEMYRLMEGRLRDSARNVLTELEAQLPPERFSAAYQRGQQLDLDDVVSELISPKANQ